MPERRASVVPVEHFYECDNCGSRNVLPTGTALMSAPPKFPHRCADCKREYTFPRQYPFVEYRQIAELKWE